MLIWVPLAQLRLTLKFSLILWFNTPCTNSLFPTQSSGNTLYVVITNSVDVLLPQKIHIPVVFSEHLAVLSCVDLSSFSYSATATLSAPARILFSSFDSLSIALSSNLFSDSISIEEHCVKNWFACFEKILQQFLERKRQKRFELSWYYNSVHLHKKVKTASTFCSLHSLPSLNEDLCISIELDAACFVTEFDEKHKGLSACYKLIDKLQRTPIPTEMTFYDDKLCGPQVFADAFNKFFISVYNPPINTAVDFCDRMFNNVNFDSQYVSSALSAALSAAQTSVLSSIEAPWSYNVNCHIPQRWKYAQLLRLSTKKELNDV